MHFSMRKTCKMKLIILMSAVLLIAFVVTAAVRVDMLYRLKAQSYASTTATRIVNAAVQDVIERNSDYTNFVKIFQDKDNRITAAEGNTALMNRFKSEITVEIEKALNTQCAQNIYIPLGSIFGTSLLNNRGFNIPIKLVPVSDIKTDFYDKFENCGINNIKHSLYIGIEAELSIISYLSRSTNTMKTSVPVTETVIVGEVPIYFANGGNIALAQNTENHKNK